MTTDTATELQKITGDYTIDPAHTRIGFVVRHAMVTKVRGSFDQFEGSAHIDGSDPTKSNASVVIQVTSVNTGNEQRDNHLRTNDFFSPDDFPQITFKSTAVAPASDGNYSVTGDLTIKETTKPITIDFDYTGSATDAFGNARIGFEGSVVVNRKDWGMNWNAPLEAGGLMVSEKVTLEFDVSAIKNA